MVHSIPAAHAAPVGVQNPTVSTGLAPAADFAAGMQFLNLVSYMNPYDAVMDDNSRILADDRTDYQTQVTTPGLISLGHLDTNYNILSIPPDAQYLRCVWLGNQNNESYERKSGAYTMKWDGTGTIQVAGQTQNVVMSANSATFEIYGSCQFVYHVLSVDETDPIRNVEVVKDTDLALYNLGARFQPDWLDLLRPNKQLRFMDWILTNNSTDVDWSDRCKPGDGPRRTRRLEDAIEICNQTGCDGWFNIPHLADANYIQQYAQLVKDNLDPSLKAYFEFSNECFNWRFQQAQWLLRQSRDDWYPGWENIPDGDPLPGDYASAHVKYSVKAMLIVESVFSGDDASRLVKVLATQTGSTAMSAAILSAGTWQENEPDDWVDPRQFYDVLAATCYFGGSDNADETLRAALINAITDPAIDEFEYLYGKLSSVPDHTFSIPFLVSRLQGHKDLIASSSLQLMLYEGGQHIDHSFGLGQTPEEEAETKPFLEAFVDSAQCALLFTQMYEALEVITDGPFMQFLDIDKPNQYGSFGLVYNLDSPTLRSTALYEQNADGVPWWTGPYAEGGEKYQSGITRRFVDGDNVVVSTRHRNFIAGGSGNDTFYTVGGVDGFDGGGGSNLVVFPDAIETYTISEDAGGHRVTNGVSDVLVRNADVQFKGSAVTPFSAMTFTNGAYSPDVGDFALADLAPSNMKVLVIGLTEGRY